MHQLQEANKTVPTLDKLAEALGMDMKLIVDNQIEALATGDISLAMSVAFREGTLMGYLYAKKELQGGNNGTR